jgi:hypothetical protein
MPVQPQKERGLGLYLIERNFPEEVDLPAEVVSGAKLVIAEEGNEWLRSFLSADKKKMYCLYEAPNPETIRAAAERLGLPVDAIIPVDQIDVP